MVQLTILSEIEVVHASTTTAENAEDNYTWERTYSVLYCASEAVYSTSTDWLQCCTARENFEN